MDFELDETHEAIVQVAAKALDTVDTPDRAWFSLAQAGLLGLCLPTWLGGDEVDALGAMVLLTETGRRAAVGPVLATLAMGVLPVVRWGTRDQQRELLSGVADGSVLLTAAVRPSTASLDDGVSGTMVGVPYAAEARWILVPVGPDAVAVVTPTGPGVNLTRTPTSAGTPEYTVVLDRAPAVSVLEAPAEGLHELAVAGACAVGDGAVAGALALTSAHVAGRHQFGRPLATFQAVALQIADVYVASRTLHLAALSVGWRLGTGRDAGGDVAVAAYWLATEAPVALRTCHHLHGGLGLDVTYPLHRYSSLIRDLVRFLGGAEYCLERIGGQPCSSI